MRRRAAASSAYLGDGCALESLLAVHPSSATRDALRPVPGQQDVRGEAGGVREAGVRAQRTGTREGGLVPGHRAGAVPALMGRRGSGEDAHHHVEGEEDLRQTDPDVENFLISPKAADGREDLVEIHFGAM